MDSLFADFEKEIQYAVEVDVKKQNSIKNPSGGNALEQERLRKQTSEEYVSSLFGEALRQASKDEMVTVTV